MPHKCRFCHHKTKKGLCAGIWITLRLTGVFEEENFQYARQDERERMDKDSGMAGVPGLSQRDQRRSQDAATVGASQARKPKTRVFWLRAGGEGDRRGVRTRGAGSAVVGVSHHGGDRVVPSALSGMWGQGTAGAAVAQQGTVQQAV